LSIGQNSWHDLVSKNVDSYLQVQFALDI
jgi:hypothetical protein